uniref:Uncharacterized protein n=1 Tax=Caenorhabditis japonica TaxID=281687 RepID=A0A8R1IH90_CAEJA
MLLLRTLSTILTVIGFSAALRSPSTTDTTNDSLMRMVDNELMDKFIPREYKQKRRLSGSGEQDVTKDNNFGFSEQGMKDLDEVCKSIGCEHCIF